MWRSCVEKSVRRAWLLIVDYRINTFGKQNFCISTCNTKNNRPLYVLIGYFSHNCPTFVQIKCLCKGSPVLNPQMIKINPFFIWRNHSLAPIVTMQYEWLHKITQYEHLANKFYSVRHQHQSSSMKFWNKEIKVGLSHKDTYEGYALNFPKINKNVMNFRNLHKII